MDTWRLRGSGEGRLAHSTLALRRRPRAANGVVIACLVSLGGCGAKTSLPPTDDDADSGRGIGSRRDRDRDERPSGAGGAAPDPPCSLEIAGDPLVAADFAEGNAGSPHLVAVESGVDGPATLVLQATSQDANFWHPELRLSRWGIGADWPGGAVVEQPFTLAGYDAHAAGRIGFLPGGRVGVAWFRGDEAAGLPSGLKFRPLEPKSWALGDEAFVDPKGEGVYSIAPRKGHPDTQWAITYRGLLPDLSVETRIAVVNARAELVVPPIVIAGARDYPGLAAETVSTGDGWLSAVAFADCVTTDSACDDDAVVVFAVEAGLTDAGREPTSALLPRARFPVAAPGTVPRRVSLARDGDWVWLAWSEARPDDDLAPRRIVLAAVNAAGEVAVEPRVIAQGVVSVSVHVAAGPDGPVVVWGEPGDPAASPEQVGAGSFVVHHERASAAPEATRIVTTALGYGPGTPAIELQDPRSVVVSWTSSLPGALRTGVWLSRLDCR